MLSYSVLFVGLGLFSASQDLISGSLLQQLEAVGFSLFLGVKNVLAYDFLKLH